MESEKRDVYLRWALILAAAALVGLFIWQPWKTNPIDEADQSWTDAVSQREACEDGLPASQSLTPAFDVASAQCDRAFVNALQAVTWPAEFLEEAERVENDAYTAANYESQGTPPPTAVSQQFLADYEQLDDDLARARLNG